MSTETKEIDGRKTTQPSSPLSVRVAYYLSVILPIVAYLLIAQVQYHGTIVKGSTPSGFAIAQLLLLLFPLTSSFLAVTGMLVFGPPRDRRPDENWHWNPDFQLIVAYVSRGNQPETLHQATEQTQKVLDQLGVNYELEMVTDIEVPEDHRLPHSNGQSRYYLVPAEYQTKRGARFKARALQYLLEERTKRLNGEEDHHNIWLLHMDEESVLTPECVLGILEFISKHDLRTSPGAIGQGEIKYNSRDYGIQPLIAAIDAGRTGGDLGLFRTQYRAAHSPLVGMHGSYVLTPARIEREITWDVGGHGSVTEDSYFALMAMQRGIPFGWVEGYIREQSPFTIMDIIRQRRRWFCGLSFVARDPALNFFTTLTLRLYVWFWAFAALSLPLPLLYLAFVFTFGSGLLPYWLFMMAAICTGFYAASYSVGVFRNILDCKIPGRRKIGVVLTAIVAWFFFVPAIVECAGTIYGIFFPVTTFYVVAKDHKRGVAVTSQ
ncbi:MAG: glycosyltransferase family 2 protein [Planctomycetaceae bacterium]|nr:glycosyltransferase family 2 protein [Planctomycetaceae bacterium]